MKKHTYRHGNAYFQLLMSLALLSILIVGLASSTCYSLFNRRFTEEIIAASQRTMRYETDNFENDIVTKAQTLLLDITLNSSYAAPLSALLQSQGSVAMFRAYQALETLNNIYNSMIASVIVYYPNPDMLLSSNMGYKSLADTYNAQYRAFADSLEYTPGTPVRWRQLEPELSLPGLAADSLLLTAAAQWPNISPNNGAIIVIALRPEYIASALERIAAIGSAVYLTDAAGAVLHMCGTPEPLAWHQPWGEALLRGESASIVPPADSGGKLYIARHVAGPDWFLILAMPTDAYAQSSAEVGRTTLLVVAVGLAVGLLLTVLLTRRLYSPIGRLMETVNKLSLNTAPPPLN